ncbi:MAG: phenylalanine--tRNA ligase subunit beta [Oscillospiraceae bacterium]|nr:phenylalanine--tRNA ligase subunit beta [Oscillospiraceae bacterium]
MKLSRKWLSEFVDTGAVSDREYAERMTLSGSKVESVEDVGAAIQNVVVGRLLSVAPHENSDHLSICSVDAGRGGPLTIVTGAKNIRAGDLVPLALDGAVLPGGVRIKKSVLRGVPSEGMLCSLKELGLTVHDFPYAVEDGIFILQEDCRAGEDIRPVLGLDDRIVDFEITNNRPDCLSVIGLARETAAAFGKKLRLHTPRVQGSGGEIGQDLSVSIADPDLCSRYTARMVKNVRIAPSPQWMRERLRASGIRPINNIVDITNYVMLEYGQPMHAFDASCIRGGKIVVRRAGKDAAITTLDGVLRPLKPHMLVIADETHPIGIAGVMGGANSEITDKTGSILLESANFSGVSVRKTAIALGLRTDASGRFEKGLDPENTLPAVQRACELVELLGAGDVVGGVADVVANPPAPVTLLLEPDKINRLLGTDLSSEEMKHSLSSLGFSFSGEKMTVPSWRGDVRHYSDIAEEVARLYGYDKIPAALMRGETTLGGLTAAQTARRQLGALCRGMGFSEIMTYSFLSPSCHDKIRMREDDPHRKAIRILNPLGEDTSILRTHAIPSMLETLARNLSCRNSTAWLYEFATIYRPREEISQLADERQLLSLGAYGGNMDFYVLKGMVEAILASMRISSLSFTPEPDVPAYHPGRCACVSSGGTPLGIFGQVHPLAAQNYGMSQDTPVFAAQLRFFSLLSRREPEPQYQPLPRFPSISRDIALVCDRGIPVAVLEECIARGSSGLVRGVQLFDVYTGAPIPQGKKSVAFSLTLRSDDKTLTDAEADQDVGAILALLKSEANAVLR